MKRTGLNLLAGAVIMVGGLYLSTSPAYGTGVQQGVPVPASYGAWIGGCTGPAGAHACTCTSGDGLYTCQGDYCDSYEHGCTYGSGTRPAKTTAGGTE